MNTDPTVPSDLKILRAERDRRPHYLEEAEGPEPSRQFALGKDELVIGRAEDADIRVLSQKASRRHAVLVRKGQDFVVYDEDSRNGIYLNGIKVYSATLRDGDVLQVAEGVFIYREG